MDENTFVSTMKRFLDFYEKTLNDAQWDIWFNCCKNLSPDEFEGAFERFIEQSTDRRFPVPGQVLEFVDRPKRAFFDTEEGKALKAEIQRS
jgi:hypothetical protein